MFLDHPRFRSTCARAALSRFEERYYDERLRQRWVEFFYGVESRAAAGG